MNVVGRILGFLWGGLLVASVVGTLAARATKRRIVPIDDPASDEIRLAAIFEPMSFRSTATSFRGGSVDCWYGGGTVDLREAVLDPTGARLRVRAIFGGAQIVVPETWQVTSNVVGIGGVGDGRPHVDRAPDAPHVAIEGFALFGGFGVSSELSEAQVHQLDRMVARRARHEARHVERQDKRAGHRAAKPTPQAEPAI
jgi:hypothetical protein